MDAIDEIIEREGGFSNRPSDRGGPTKYGITLKTLAQWRKHAVTEQDVRDLTVDEARAIYEQEYLKGPHIDQIPDAELAHLVMDIGVMSGPDTAIRLLQRCLVEHAPIAVIVDGILGPQTLAALWAIDPLSIRTQLVVKRVVALVDLVQHDVSQLEYLEGWVRRALKFLPRA